MFIFMWDVYEKQVWPIEGKKKFETLSYLPPLTDIQLTKQIDYLLRSGWVPCIEFCKVIFYTFNFTVINILRIISIEICMSSFI